MVYSVVFNRLSHTDIKKIDSYLFSKWGGNSVMKFHNILSEFKRTVSKSPTVGVVCKIIKGKEIRQYPITKQNMILHRIEGSKIKILKIFDVRQHPNKKLQGIK